MRIHPVYNIITYLVIYFYLLSIKRKIFLKQFSLLYLQSFDKYEISKIFRAWELILSFVNIEIYINIYFYILLNFNVGFNTISSFGFKHKIILYKNPFKSTSEYL